MREMEEWLAQLEMEMGKDPITMNHHHHHHHQSDERMEIGAEPFDEELAAVLGGAAGDQFSSDPVLSVSGESNASNHASPGGGGQLDLDYTFLDFHSLSPDDINAISSNHPQLDHQDNWESNNNMNHPLHLGARFMGAPPQVLAQQHHQSSSSSDSAVVVAAGGDHHDDDQKKISKKGATSTKRKREPNQVQDHIMAERKRRELLSTQFISLSSILPGLKKTDKTSVLGEAIKYMKQLQEKVKALEEATAKRTVESVVVVKKSQLVVADDTETDNEAYSSSVNDSEESLPEIEVKVSDKSMLIKIYCQKHKGILPKLFQELEDHHLSVVNSSVIPFGTLALDITIHAQLDRELNANVKEVIQGLRSAVSPLGP